MQVRLLGPIQVLQNGVRLVAIPEAVRLAKTSARRMRAACNLLSAGLSEKERDIVYNTQVLIGPDGYIGKQRKLHLSRDEVNHYKGGRDILVFDVGPCKVGAVICYDNQFPEIARVLDLPSPFHVYRRVNALLAQVRRALEQRGVESSVP